MFDLIIVADSTQTFIMHVAVAALYAQASILDNIFSRH